MDQEKKKINIKIIIPILLVIVTIIAIIEGIVIFTSGNKSNDNKLTEEEQLAVDYLLCNGAIKPNDTEIHRVWIYKEDNKYYFAYDINSGNFAEQIYGNKDGITLEELKNLKITTLGNHNYTAPAKEKGKQLNAEKIQKAFQEQW